jgi:hypothetical protein
MFIVKHCANFVETLYEATDVSYQANQIHNPNDLAPGVHIKLRDGAAVMFTAPASRHSGDPFGQTIFVMNDNGKTVAKYDL